MAKIVAKPITPPFLRQQKGETDKAFFLFQRYVGLPAKERSLKTFCERYKVKETTAIRYFQLWSWDIRVKELVEPSEVEILKDEDISLVEQTRLVAQIESRRMLQVIIDLALDEDVKPGVRLSAAKDVLDRAGIVPPKRLEIKTTEDYAGFEGRLKKKVESLTNDELSRLSEIFGLD